MKRSVQVNGVTIHYTLVQSVRRDVLLKALPHGETRVYAPKGMRLRDIDALVKENAQRILQMHRQLDAALQTQAQPPLRDGATVPLEGRHYTLRVAYGAPKLSLTENEMRLTLPQPENDEAVRETLRGFLAERALHRIREKLEYYGPRIGGSYGRVTIREQRTRWGSCSSKHNLNFNWKLILAPPEALDYVVIHELCHLHEFNHSPRFWSLVEAQMPEYEVWKRWLKEHGSELHL
ncbi:MAG: M48 family metallopeptidase [Clostridia bacterium]|nr:M48 family metallopeptidase [Clostridia bacterium]